MKPSSCSQCHGENTLRYPASRVGYIECPLWYSLVIALLALALRLYTLLIPRSTSATSLPSASRQPTSLSAVETSGGGP